MEHEPSGPFITSVLELKLDPNTMFEWQKFSQDSSAVPHYQKLLEFLNLRAQASEASVSDSRKAARVENRNKKGSLSKPVTSFAANATNTENDVCVLCKPDKHLLFACPRFKDLPHDQKIATLKKQEACMNCLRPGHFIKQCRSHHRCHKCQKTTSHFAPCRPETYTVSTKLW